MYPKIRLDKRKHENRLTVYKLKNEGLSNSVIGKKLDLTPQGVSQMWHRVRFYTLQELEQDKKDYEDSQIDEGSDESDYEFER